MISVVSSFCYLSSLKLKSLIYKKLSLNNFIKKEKIGIN